MKFIIYQAMHTNRMFSFLFYHVINCLGFSLCLNPPEISFIHYKDIIVFMKLGICLPSLLSVTLYFSLLVALVLLSMNNNLLILLCVFLPLLLATRVLCFHLCCTLKLLQMEGSFFFSWGVSIWWK